MKEINSIFLVLLLVLGVLIMFGYLINELIDYNQLIQENEVRIAELESQLAHCNNANNDLAVQIDACQTGLGEKNGQLSQIQETYEQLVVDYQGLQGELSTKEALLSQTQQELTGIQNELDGCQAAADEVDTVCQPESVRHVDMPIPVASVIAGQGGEPDINYAGLIVGTAGGLGVMLVVWARVIRQGKSIQPSASRMTATNPPAKQVTVKMNSQAYQGYLDYLKRTR